MSEGATVKQLREWLVTQPQSAQVYVNTDPQHNPTDPADVGAPDEAYVTLHPQDPTYDDGVTLFVRAEDADE